MSTFLGIWWLWWALGTFGVVGTALMLWLAPALLVQLAAGAVRFFIGTRIGNIILAAAVAFWVADVNRSLRDARDFEAYKAGLRQAQIQRDKTIAHDTRATVMREMGEQALANAKIDQQVKEFKDALPPIPQSPVAGTNPFLVGDASCRLRAIAGYPGCEPERAAGGVPKARPESGGAGAKHRPKIRLPRLITRGAGGAEKGQ